MRKQQNSYKGKFDRTFSNDNAHTNDAKGAIIRFMDYGITRQEIEQSLLAVVDSDLSN